MGQKFDETALKRHLQYETVPSMIRAWNRQSATRLATEVTFQILPLPRKMTVQLHQILHLPRKVRLELHQILHLHEHFVLKNKTFRAPAIIPNFTKYCPCHQKWQFNFTTNTAPATKSYPHHWSLSYNARSNRCYCPTSPKTAFATKSHTHHGSLSNLKRYIQCGEQQVSMIQPHQRLRLPRKMTVQNVTQM